MLDLAAQGLTSCEIAVRLSLGRRTVEYHISHILAKLGAPNRSAAAAIGVQLASSSP